MIQGCIYKMLVSKGKRSDEKMVFIFLADFISNW